MSLLLTKITHCKSPPSHEYRAASIETVETDVLRHPGRADQSASSIVLELLTARVLAVSSGQAERPEVSLTLASDIGSNRSSPYLVTLCARQYQLSMWSSLLVLVVVSSPSCDL